MQGKHLVFIGFILLMSFFAPLVIFFVSNIVISSKSDPYTWTTLYSIILFSFSILGIVMHYVTEKKILQGIKDKSKISFMTPEITLFYVGLGYTYAPVCYGLIFTAIGFGIGPTDMLILMAISYVGMIAWSIRWFVKYYGT
jgi:hypothetical protein